MTTIDMDEDSDAICAATAAGDVALLKSLLAEATTRCPADAADQYGVTALTIGCCMGHDACVDLLLEHGADANLLCSKLGPSPLHMACQEKRPELVGRLLDARADPALRLANRTAMQVAEAHGCSKCVELLRVAQQLQDRPSTAHMCDAAVEGDAETLERLLDSNADVNAKDVDGEHCLLHASAFGHANCVRLLLEHNAAVDQQSDSGSSALSAACLSGHEDSATLLVNARANVALRCELGTTALHSCAAGGHRACAALLICAGVPVDAADARGATALHYAACEGMHTCIALLLASDANALIAADGQTALQMACAREHLECKSLLAAAEADARRKRADAAAADLLADEARRQAADEALRQAMAQGRLTALRDALDRCGLDASDQAVATARAMRDRLKKKQKKSVAKGSKGSPSTPAGLPPSSDAIAAERRTATPSTEPAVEATEPTVEESIVEESTGTQGRVDGTPLAHGAVAASSAPSSALEVPAQFLCPITLQIMEDPVITADGHAYERKAIEDWLQRQSTSPSTGMELRHRVLTPSIALRQLIADFHAS